MPVVRVTAAWPGVDQRYKAEVIFQSSSVILQLELKLSSDMLLSIYSEAGISPNSLLGVVRVLF